MPFLPPYRVGPAQKSYHTVLTSVSMVRKDPLKRMERERKISVLPDLLRAHRRRWNLEGDHSTTFSGGVYILQHPTIYSSIFRFSQF